jgi:hypothetical protein
MHTMNRRMFLMGGAAASALLIGKRYLSANPLRLPIGCQTHPVRESISSDFAGTMKGLRAAGFTQIELCSHTATPIFLASDNTSHRSCGAC